MWEPHAQRIYAIAEIVRIHDLVAVIVTPPPAGERGISDAVAHALAGRR